MSDPQETGLPGETDLKGECVPGCPTCAPEPMCYIARDSHGCILFAAVDTPDMKRDNAKEIAACIRKGLTVERVSLDVVRSTPFGCQRERPEVMGDDRT